MTTNRLYKKTIQAGLALVLVLAFQGNVLAMGKLKKDMPDEKQAQSRETVNPSQPALPKLVDLGAKKCIPCKMMAPILEELEAEYQGKMDVLFIDVWQQPDQGQQYGVRVIPTQIFFAPDGTELFRHQGYISKEDILATWKKFGYEFGEQE